MTQLERLQRRVPDEPDEGILLEMLESAKCIILSLRYPYGDWPEELEARHLDLQIRMAVDLYDRLGAEGQLSHAENGIARSWGAEWVSEQLCREVVPYCGVV